ncbi:MAG TPA: hypothetical protein VH439_17480 [Gemmatimonadales bacterium]|jgi:hypothetical protein
MIAPATQETRHRCPHCHNVPECVTLFGRAEAVPEPGDASLCFECGGLSFYGDDGVRRLPTKAECEDARHDARIGKAYAIYLLLRARRLRLN